MWQAGRDGKCTQTFGVKDINERGHLEDIGVDGNIKLKRALTKQTEGVGMDVPHSEKVRVKGFVTTVISVGVTFHAEDFLTSLESASQE